MANLARDTLRLHGNHPTKWRRRQDKTAREITVGFQSTPSTTRARPRTATAAGTAPRAVEGGFGAGGAPRPPIRRGQHSATTPTVETAPGRDRPRPSLRPLLLPPRLPQRYRFHPITTARSLRERGNPSLKTLAPRLAPPPPQRPIWMLLALLPNYSLEFGDNAARCSHADWKREQ